MNHKSHFVKVLFLLLLFLLVCGGLDVVPGISAEIPYSGTYELIIMGAPAPGSGIFTVDPSGIVTGTFIVGEDAGILKGTVSSNGSVVLSLITTNEDVGSCIGTISSDGKGNGTWKNVSGMAGTWTCSKILTATNTPVPTSTPTPPVVTPTPTPVSISPNAQIFDLPPGYSQKVVQIMRFPTLDNVPHDPMSLSVLTDSGLALYGWTGKEKFTTTSRIMAKDITMNETSISEAFEFARFSGTYTTILDPEANIINLNYANNRLLVCVGPVKGDPLSFLLVRITGPFDPTSIWKAKLY